MAYGYITAARMSRHRINPHSPSRIQSDDQLAVAQAMFRADPDEVEKVIQRLTKKLDAARDKEATAELLILLDRLKTIIKSPGSIQIK